MKIKANHIIIPSIVIAVAVAGSLATSANIANWYNHLTLPSIAPPGWIIGIVWTILYASITVSALLFWNRKKSEKYCRLIIITALLNIYLNVFWSITFFSLHMIAWAILVSSIMAITIYALIILIYPRQKTAALLLVPYGLWVTFATYLNYLIWTLN